MSNLLATPLLTHAYKPTPYLKRILTQGEKEFAAGKYKAFDSIKKLRAGLNK